MDWDNIILKILFFTIIILMIMCPLRKLLVEGFDTIKLRPPEGRNAQNQQVEQKDQPFPERIIRKGSAVSGNKVYPGDRIEFDVRWSDYVEGAYASDVTGDITGKEPQGKENFPSAKFLIDQDPIDDSRIFRKATIQSKKITKITFFYIVNHEDIIGSIKHRVSIKRKGAKEIKTTPAASGRNLQNVNFLKKVNLSIKGEPNLEEVTKGKTVVLTILLRNKVNQVGATNWSNFKPQFKSGGENIKTDRITYQPSDGNKKIEYSYKVNTLDDKGDITWDAFRIGTGAVNADPSDAGVTVSNTTDGSKIERVSDDFFMCKLPEIMQKGIQKGSWMQKVVFLKNHSKIRKKCSIIY